MHVGVGAMGLLSVQIAERWPKARLVVISDETVARAVPSPLDGVPRLTFPAGERHKVRSTWADLTDRMLAAGLGRDTVVIGIGGGVTTDLAGFVAATFLRGVPWIAVPTSLLAMVDAAIGGKTGVDAPAGKNLVGAFHQPELVLCDPAVLVTLPDAAFREGVVEAIKHAAALDAEYGTWLESHATAVLARDGTAITALVHRSVELKGAVVSGDERESGARAALNAGHTIGHAIEQASDFAVSHGDAVAVGLLVETRIAEAIGCCAPGTAARIEHLLAAYRVPTAIPSLPVERILQGMAADKKNRGGEVRAALLASFGQMQHREGDWTMPLPPERVAAAFR